MGRRLIKQMSKLQWSAQPRHLKSSISLFKSSWQFLSQIHNRNQHCQASNWPWGSKTSVVSAKPQSFLIAFTCGSWRQLVLKLSGWMVSASLFKFWAASTALSTKTPCARCSENMKRIAFKIHHISSSDNRRIQGKLHLCNGVAYRL